MAIDNAFWLGRWQRGETGWHLPRVHPKLMKHWSSLQLATDTCVFVPLSGKSLDIAWLAQQHKHVYACELSEVAVQQFFAELNVQPKLREIPSFRCYHHQNITIYVGDIFALEPSHLGDVTALYDRAALVALPPEVRRRYVQHLQQLLPVGNMLLITLSYRQSEMAGPPFSVDAQGVNALFASSAEIAQLDDQQIIQFEPGMASKGLSSLFEQVFTVKWPRN